MVSRVLLLTAGATAVAMAAAATGNGEIAAGGTAVAVGAMAAHAARGDQRGLRWSLAAALSLMALATLVTTLGYAATPATDGEQVWRDSLAGSQAGALAIVPALIAFAVALCFRPRQSARTAPASIVAVIPLFLAAVTIPEKVDSMAAVGSLLASTAPLLLAAGAGAAVLFLAVQRAAKSWSLPVAALIPAAVTAVAFAASADTWRRIWELEHPSGNVSAMVLVTAAPDIFSAIAVVLTLAVPAFLAWAILRDATSPATV